MGQDVRGVLAPAWVMPIIHWCGLLQEEVYGIDVTVASQQKMARSQSRHNCSGQQRDGALWAVLPPLSLFQQRVPDQETSASHQSVNSMSLSCLGVSERSKGSLMTI